MTIFMFWMTLMAAFLAGVVFGIFLIFRFFEMQVVDKDDEQ